MNVQSKCYTYLKYMKQQFKEQERDSDLYIYNM